MVYVIECSIYQKENFVLKADFHIHSTISDGSDSIHTIIAQALEKQIFAIAITDHDTLAHRKHIPLHPGLIVLTGVEISAHDKESKKKAHILGYNIQNPTSLENWMLPTLLKRHQNSLKQIEVLQKNKFSIHEHLLNKADGKYIYKQHILEYLLKTGQIQQMYESFYDSVFKNHGLCDFDIEYPDIYEAVEMILFAGGIPVLAHPGQQQNFELIPKLVPHGLKGLEYNHYSNEKLDKTILKSYSEEHHLFLTGGSDYHGKNQRERTHIGDYLSESSGSNSLIQIK